MNFEGLPAVPCSLLPADVTHTENILRRYGLSLAGLRSSTASSRESSDSVQCSRGSRPCVPLQLDVEATFNQLSEQSSTKAPLSSTELAGVRATYAIIEAGKELGLTKQELRRHVDGVELGVLDNVGTTMSRQDLIRWLKVLLAECLVLEVGVVESRWAFFLYNSPCSSPTHTYLPFKWPITTGTKLWFFVSQQSLPQTDIFDS